MRPRKVTPSLVSRARAGIASGATIQEVAAELGVGVSTLYGALATSPATTNGAARAPAPVAPAPREQLGPPTENDRKVDALVAGSRTWRRVQETLSRALAVYPEAAAAAARALRALDL